MLTLLTRPFLGLAPAELHSWRPRLGRVPPRALPRLLHLLHTPSEQIAIVLAVMVFRPDANRPCVFHLLLIYPSVRYGTGSTGSKDV